jgi:hypothetical protein
MDTACGMSTLCAAGVRVCPTLDLRIDYMHAAEPNKHVYGFAQCYRVTTDVIFHPWFRLSGRPEQPIAHVVGTFMRMGKGIKGGKALVDDQGRAGMMHRFKQQLQQAHERGDYGPLLA